MINKKGQTTIPLFTLIVTGFIFIIILGSFLYFFGIVNDSFSGDISAGSVNVTNSSANTIGKLNSAFLGTGDLIGIFFLFGVVFAIIINGFLTRNSTIKLMFMIDFLLIIFAYILAVYISNSYENILVFLPFSNLIATNLNNTSRFVLFLPVITVVVGFITMIVTYAGIPRTSEEAQVAGF